jgi:hypothetical protein
MSWSSAVDSKLIHDFEVGLSSTSNGIAPDIFPFRSSKHHSHFRLNHPDVPNGREFYVVIKSIGKSGINGLQVINVSSLFSLKASLYSHVENGSISLGGEAWVQETSSTPPLFIEMPVSNQKCGRSLYMCVGVVDF